MSAIILARRLIIVRAIGWYCPPASTIPPLFSTYVKIIYKYIYHYYHHIEVPNFGLNMNSHPKSACYPQSSLSFYRCPIHVATPGQYALLYVPA